MKSIKPPIGIIPKKLWQEQRLSELAAAIIRYLDAGKFPPEEWLDEFDELESQLDESKMIVNISLN